MHLQADSTEWSVKVRLQLWTCTFHWESREGEEKTMQPTAVAVRIFTMLESNPPNQSFYRMKKGRQLFTT